MLDIFMFQEIFLLIGKLEVLRYIAVMQEEKEQHFLLYKPDGYLSQFDINEPKGYKKKLLGEIYDFPEGTMAILRLVRVRIGDLVIEGMLPEQVTPLPNLM